MAIYPILTVVQYTFVSAMGSCHYSNYMLMPCTNTNLKFQSPKSTPPPNLQQNNNNNNNNKPSISAPSQKTKYSMTWIAAHSIMYYVR